MTTTIATNISVFNLAQTFYVDPGSVMNSPEVSITSVGLYFQAVPKQTGNQSGINSPGVDIFLCETTTNADNEVPDTTNQVYGAHARVEYANITADTTANTETVFTFPFPVNLTTGQTYAIVVKFDDPAFELWTSVQGYELVGTNNTTAGPAGKYIGNYFEYSYTATTVAANSALSTAANISGNWKPLSSTDLKFNVYVAKFISDTYANTTVTDPTSGNVVSVSIGSTSYMLYKNNYEYILYDFINSTNWSQLVNGELIYQNNVVRPETLTVIAGNNHVYGTNVNFSTIFGNDNSIPRYLVLYSGSQKNVRKISSLVSNTQLQLEVAPTFSNSSAQFSQVVAGTIDVSARTKAFGTLEDIIVIDNSSANSSLRFSNNTIETFVINAGGTAYNNTDILIVYDGGANGGAVEANAAASLSTNSSGGIVSLTPITKGVGFYTAPSFTVYKAGNTVASTGTGANFSFTIGSTLLTEVSNAVLANTHVINIPINSTVAGAIDVENPYGTSYYFKRHFLYYASEDGIADFKIENSGTGYSNVDTITTTGGGGANAYGTLVTDSSGRIISTDVVDSGQNYSSIPTAVITTSSGTGAVLTPIVGVSRYSVSNGLNSDIINLFERTQTSSTNAALILSHSVEVLQSNSTITTVTGETVNTTSSSVVEMVVSSNNVYVAADILSAEVDFFIEKYAINNDYTDENTRTGDAISKHISFIQTFANNSLAEDLIITLDMYRPTGTDVKVFAKIYNNADPDPFINKDWTLMQITSGANVYSSPIDTTDINSYTFGFYPYPNSAFTLSGSITTTLNSANIIGSNTSFTANLAVGDVVKLTNPLFSNNYMISTVNTITNNTLIILDNVIANSDVVGSGFFIDKIEYPYQAFNYALNNNMIRYYGSNNEIFDGYNSFAIKLVFISDSDFIVPRVDDIQAIGTTA